MLLIIFRYESTCVHGGCGCTLTKMYRYNWLIICIYCSYNLVFSSAIDVAWMPQINDLLEGTVKAKSSRWTINWMFNSSTRLKALGNKTNLPDILSRAGMGKRNNINVVTATPSWNDLLQENCTQDHLQNI